MENIKISISYLKCIYLYGNTGIKSTQCTKMFVALLCITFALNLYMKIGTKLLKFKTLTQVRNITFFFPTHTYRATQNTLNNCVNFSCV